MRRPALTVVVLAALAACKGPPQLGATEQQVVNALPSSWDFGAVPVGGSATPRQITVSVGGLQNEFHQLLSVTEGCADFALDLSQIPSFPAEVYRYCETCETCSQAAVCESQTQRFTVDFRPTIAGPQACTITVELDDVIKYVTVMGTGVAPDFDLVVLEPAGNALAFGDVVVGSTSAVLPITVRNDGTMDLDIFSADLVDGEVGEYLTTGTGATLVAPGDTRTFTTQCRPTFAGMTSATFAITSNDPAEPSVAIALTCNGIQSNLAIDPSPARLPETFLDDTTSITVTLTNTGMAAMNVDDLSVQPSQFTVSGLTDPMIGPGGSTDVTVEFTADASVVDQDVQGTLTVTYDGSESRSIDLVGPARTAILSVTPGGEVDFGTVCGGQRGSRVFAAINLGSGAFELIDASVAGSSAGSGATAAFELSATPPDGPVTGTFTLTPDVPNLGPTTVTLLANGQLDGVAAYPAAVAFEAVIVDEASGGRAVRLNNCEATPLTVTSATVTGPHARDFTAVTELTFPATIPPFGNATWLVELTPSAAGDRTATLELVHDGGTTPVPLTGFGLEDEAEGRGSYYACSSSGARTLSPLLVALALLLLPRRRRVRSP